MGCKRFENQLMDLALDGLLPEREAELREHLRECAACQADFERQRQLVAVMDRGLEQVATAEPSPEILARIRVKIGEQPPPRRGWSRGRWPAVAGAMAAAALLAYLMIPGGEAPLAPTNTPPVATEQEPQPQLAETAPPAAVKSPRRPIRSAPAAVATHTAQPEVLVPRDQEEAVAWLYRVQQREPKRFDQVMAAVAEQAKASAAPVQVQELQTAPLEVAPIQPLPDLSGSETK
jgi:hypothetical protein